MAEHQLGCSDYNDFISIFDHATGKRKKKERKKFPQKRDLASCDINSTALFFFLLVWLRFSLWKTSTPAQLMSFLMSRLARAGPLWSREGALGEGRGASSCQRRFCGQNRGGGLDPNTTVSSQCPGVEMQPLPLFPPSDPGIQIIRCDDTYSGLRSHIFLSNNIKQKQTILTLCLRVLNCQWQPLKRWQLTKHKKSNNWFDF